MYAVDMHVCNTIPHAKLVCYIHTYIRTVLYGYTGAYDHDHAYIHIHMYIRMYVYVHYSHFIYEL